MRILVLLIGLLLAPLWQVAAQVVVEVHFEQEQFLPGETLPAIVKIRNRSGQTLHLGRDPDWLTFSAESKDGFVVVKTGEAPVVGEFTLGTSKVATKIVNLQPYFDLTRQGRYVVSATVNIKEWGQQIPSAPKAFDIITGAKLWTQEFGVPAPSGAPTQMPEVRRYTLQQANYLRKQLRLYLRLTDGSETKVLKVIPIGQLVGMSRPEAQLDQSNNLHVLYQNGAHTFSYTMITPNGEVVAQQTYDLLGSRPRLQSTKEGRIVVAGGVRRAAANDIPAPSEKKDEAPAPKP